MSISANPRTRPPLRFATKVRIALLIALLVSGLVWVGQMLVGNRLNRWLPERTGDAVVLEKVTQGSRGWALRVRLEVPPASPKEAALIPPEVEGRAALVGSRTFELEVPVGPEKWDTVAPGARLRALYHVNVGRTSAFIRILYLDALDSSRSVP